MQEALDLYRTTAPPRLREKKMVALDAAMVGAATAVTGVQALWANIEGDIRAFAGGLDRSAEIPTYKSGPDPTAIIRDADANGKHAMFRVMTWAYLTEIISEFWWPDYVWETADYCAAFGLEGRGERRVVALGPDPGRVRKEAELSAEYVGLKIRVTLQACVETVAGETVPNDYPAILMAEENWFEVYSAGEDAMQEALKEQAPTGMHYVKGVPEAREGQPLQHDPPPRPSGDDAGANFDGAVALCESVRAMLENVAPFPDLSIKEDVDVNEAWNIFAKELGADNEQQWGCITDAIMVGYTVRAAETRAGQAQRGPLLEVFREHPLWVTVDMEARTREAEIPQIFAYGPVGWAAVQRWSSAYVSDRYRKATGDTQEFDLVTATGYGYGFRRAVQALSPD